ncbi:MAG: putative transposase [Verrucomicrobiales bacterium]|jgi:putative transposase
MKEKEKSRLPFIGLNEHGHVRIYYNGLLPHWRQSGCTYFVTFRLADSVPRAVLDKWEYEKTRWLRKLGLNDWVKAYEKLPKVEQRRFERHFGALVNDYLDSGRGSCVLRDPKCAEIVAEALDHFHPTRVITGDFVIMPNHVHVLLRPNPGVELEDLMHSIKGFTANRINELLGRTGTLWKKDSYDHIVRDSAQLLRIQRYIRANPEKANIRDGEFVLSEVEYEVMVW